MKTHDLIQGSPEWLAYRATHFNASDAPAMMGCSPYKTRTQLLHEMHTGIVPEVDPSTQRRFDDGHRYEALARPLGEEIIGEPLYPITGSKGRLSASFDGNIMSDEIGFEHKSLNDELRSVMVDGCTGADLPLMYRVQMEQQCMVADSEKVLFMASKWRGEELVEERHCWYLPDMELRAQILAGWELFEKDLAEYVPAEVVIAPVAAAVTALPAVSVQVSGAIMIRDNFGAFEVALRDFIANRLILKPETDQDFADLDLQIKALKAAEEKLDAAEAQMLAQVDTVDMAKRTKDMLHKLTRDNRLMAEKLLKARKEAIRGEILAEGVAKMREHIDGLNKRLGKPYMPDRPWADFGTAISNKRTVDSLREAVKNELTRAKIESSAVADKIQINLTTLRELAKDHAFLFSDTGTIVLKDADDLTILVKSRIAEHKESEAKKEEETRERIRKEEQDRIANEQAAAALAQVAPVSTPAAAQPTTEPAAGRTVPFNTVVQMMPSAVRQAMTPAKPDTPPTLKLGVIAERLGFTVTADFLAELGFTATVERNAKLYQEADFPLICNALVEHIQSVCEQVAA